MFLNVNTIYGNDICNVQTSGERVYKAIASRIQLPEKLFLDRNMSSRSNTIYGHNIFNVLTLNESVYTI